MKDYKIDKFRNYVNLSILVTPMIYKDITTGEEFIGKRFIGGSYNDFPTDAFDSIDNYFRYKLDFDPKGGSSSYLKTIQNIQKRIIKYLEDHNIDKWIISDEDLNDETDLFDWIKHISLRIHYYKDSEYDLFGTFIKLSFGWEIYMSLKKKGNDSFNFAKETSLPPFIMYLSKSITDMSMKNKELLVDNDYETSWIFEKNGIDDRHDPTKFVRFYPTRKIDAMCSSKDLIKVRFEEERKFSKKFNIQPINDPESKFVATDRIEFMKYAEYTEVYDERDSYEIARVYDDKDGYFLIIDLEHESPFEDGWSVDFSSQSYILWLRDNIFHPAEEKYGFMKFESIKTSKTAEDLNRIFSKECIHEDNIPEEAISDYKQLQSQYKAALFHENMIGTTIDNFFELLVDIGKFINNYINGMVAYYSDNDCLLVFNYNNDIDKNTIFSNIPQKNVMAYYQRFRMDGNTMGVLLDKDTLFIKDVVSEDDMSLYQPYDESDRVEFVRKDILDFLVKHEVEDMYEPLD